MDHLIFAITNYPQTQYIALCIYVLTMTGSPGPNNVMLTASGANFGVKRTVRHIFGINFGLVSMIFLMSLGFNKLFKQYPVSQTVLFVLGAIYLLYLAYKIATSPYIDLNNRSINHVESTPLTLWQAMSFQYVNPKAWVMASNVLIFYALSDQLYVGSVAIILITFPTMALFTNFFWTAFGAIIGRYLKTPKRWRIFNISMALLLVACLPLMI